MAKRRRHGEGSCYQRADGKWIGIANLGMRTDPDGVRRRVRKTVIADTEREALRRLRKILRLAEQGVVTNAAKIDPWIIDWIDGHEKDGSIGTKTAYDYRSAAKTWIIPQLGHIRLEQLTVEDIRNMRAAIGEKRSPTMVRKVNSILRRALRDAAAQGLIERNVAALIKAPTSAKNPHETLTGDEADKVIRAAGNDLRLRARLFVALGLGVRQSEALGLRWSDFALKEKVWTLRIDSTVQQTPGKGLQEIGKTKTIASTRTIPVFKQASAALTAWRQASGAGDHDFIFHGHGGTHVAEGPRRDYAVWTAALKAAGMPHVPLHGARGSAASLMLKMKVEPIVIAVILGHSSTKTTEAHYLHVDMDQQVAALDAVDRALSRSSEVAVVDEDSPAQEIKLKLPEKLIKKVDDLAADADVTRAAWIAEVLTQAVAEIERRAEHP